MENALSKNKATLYLLVIVGLGTLFRICYGLFFRLWDTSPDHLAWELSIKNGGWSYIYLIHYPHEGGSIPISVLSKILSLLGVSSPLLIVSVCVDFIVRYFQLVIINKIAPKPVFWCFAIWCIFGSPVTLPWGMMSYGLHAVSSLFPFLLMLLLYEKKLVEKYAFQIGVLAALTYWFSFTNLLLIIVFLGFLFLKQFNNKIKLRVVIGLILSISIFVLVVLTNDAGFDLSHPNPFLPRGISIDHQSFEYNNLTKFWSSILPLSFVTESTSRLKDIVAIIIIIGLIAHVVRIKQDSKIIYVLVFVIGFGVLYSLSPYFGKESTLHYINFRHLTYIIPILVFMVLTGWQKMFKKFNYFPVVITSFFIGLSITTFKNNINNYEHIAQPTGWVLASKYGHEPRLITDILKDQSQLEDYFFGVGWGTSTSLFETFDENNINDKLKLISDLKGAYPIEFQDDFLLGVKFSFSDGVTPKLDPELLNEILNYIE